jgi:hypothetical protein
VERKPKNQEIMIIGETNQGMIFRPSDWTERLIDLSPKMIKVYSENLKIGRYNGIKTIILNEALQYDCQMTYERLLEFARINNLKVVK